MNPENCGTCVYSRIMNRGPFSDRECRRMPPTVHIEADENDVKGYAVWPIVSDDFWCAAHEDEADRLEQASALREAADALRALAGEEESDGPEPAEA